MSTSDVVRQYYDSLGARNEQWKDLYAAEALFSDASKTLNAKGKEAVIQSFVPFLTSVAGVRVKQLITEGTSACAIVAYEYVNGRGQHLDQDVAEVWETRADRLTSLTIYFDLTAYRTFMRA